MVCFLVVNPVMSLRLKMALALLTVYVIWGSTYLAIRITEESLPPFFMAGARFVLAGLIIYVWVRLHGGARETRIDWGRAFLVAD
jgi:drug/metabolite transporter (DMT)-like permease